MVFRAAEVEGATIRRAWASVGNSSWETAVWIVLSAVLLSHAVEAQSTNVPEAVRSFMSASYRSRTEEVSRIQDARGGGFYPEVSLLYFCRLDVGAPSQNAGGWLIGYRLGRDGHTWVNSAVVTDGNGRRLYSLCDESAGDCSAVFRVSRDQWAVAMAYDPAGQMSGYVRVLTLGAHPRELLRYASPATENWESKLSFVETEAHELAAIVAERDVYSGSGRWLRHESVMRQYDAARQSFGAEVLISSDRLRTTLQAAKARGGVIGITQWGSPREKGEEHEKPGGGKAAKDGG